MVCEFAFYRVLAGGVYRLLQVIDDVKGHTLCGLGTVGEVVKGELEGVALSRTKNKAPSRASTAALSWPKLSQPASSAAVFLAQRKRSSAHLTSRRLHGWHGGCTTGIPLRQHESRLRMPRSAAPSGAGHRAAY